MIKYIIIVILVLFHQVGLAQILPNHNNLRILIVSDEVNPHNLTDEELTQPGDISQALSGTASLNSSAILEIHTNQIELATVELVREPNDALAYDILIYFAHRNPSNGNNPEARQSSFVAAVELFLQNGGGVISFHHGLYNGVGKQPMQNLLGAQASGSVPWDTINGQDVIFVGGNHFIGTHEISYDLQVAYENSDHQIPAANYPAFNNMPDERYPQTDFTQTNSGCEINVLFESDYVDNGNTHLLSYTKQCPTWKSKIFVYQPGEYQPNAFSGNNYQILLNAIYYLSDNRWDVIFSNNFE